MSLNLFKFWIRFELWLQSTRQALLEPLARRAVPSPRGAARASGDVEPLPAPASFAIRAPQHPPSFSLLAGRPRGSAPRRRLSPHPAVVDSPVRIPSDSPSGMRSCPKFHWSSPASPTGTSPLLGAAFGLSRPRQRARLLHLPELQVEPPTAPCLSTPERRRPPLQALVSSLFLSLYKRWWSVLAWQSGPCRWPCSGKKKTRS
jgi:hypothetical protein